MSIPNVRRFWILWSAILLTLASMDATAEVEFNKDYSSIQLIDGVVLKRARVTRFEAGVFHVEHSGGIARVPEAKMPAEWRALAISQPGTGPVAAPGSTSELGKSAPVPADAGTATTETSVALEKLLKSPADLVGKGFALEGRIAPSAKPKESGNGYRAYDLLANKARLLVFVPEGDVTTRLNAHLAPKGGEALVTIFCAFEPYARKDGPGNEMRVIAVDWLAQAESGNGTLSRAALDRAWQYAQAHMPHDAVKRGGAPAAVPPKNAAQPGNAPAQMSFGIGDVVNLGGIGLSPVPFTLMEIGNGSIVVRIGRTGAVQKIPLKLGVAGTRTEVYRDQLGFLYYIDSAARPDGKGLFEVVRQSAPK